MIEWWEFTGFNGKYWKFVNIKFFLLSNEKSHFHDFVTLSSIFITKVI